MDKYDRYSLALLMKPQSWRIDLALERSDSSPKVGLTSWVVRGNSREYRRIQEMKRSRLECVRCVTYEIFGLQGQVGRGHCLGLGSRPRPDCLSEPHSGRELYSTRVDILRIKCGDAGLTSP